MPPEHGNSGFLRLVCAEGGEDGVTGGLLGVGMPVQSYRGCEINQLEVDT